MLFCIVLHPIIIGHLSMICYAVLYGFPMIYIFFNFRYVQKLFCKLNSNHFMVVCGIGVMTALSVIVPVIHKTMDFSYISVSLSLLRKLILFLFLFIVLMKKDPVAKHVEVFMKYYILAQCLYVCSTLIFLAIPSLKETWKLILNEEVNTNLYDAFGYAGRFGWSGFSGYRVTIVCSLSIIFINYLYFDNKSITFSVYMIGSVMLFVGNMFYGRTGIIVSAIVIIIYIFVYHNIKIKYIVFLLLSLCVLFIGLQIARQHVDYINEWYIWATKPIVQLLTGDISNSGTDSLSTVTGRMSFIPEFNTLIWGDGYYTDPVYGTYYKKTDLGYMRQLLYWGLIGTSFTYLVVMHSIISIECRRYVFKFSLIIFMVLFEYKGNMYFDVLPLFLLIGIVNVYQCRNLNEIKTILNRLNILGKR